jgi:hypothetical protein
MKTSIGLIGILGLSALAACASRGESDEQIRAAEEGIAAAKNTGSYNIHLENTVRFQSFNPAGSDFDRGRKLFGFAPDLVTGDATGALFQGHSVAFGGDVVSNGRSCFTCHRQEGAQLGLPKAPLTDHIPLSDPLFTGINADAQGDPDGFNNLNNLALIKYRPNRFNPFRPESDPYRQVFGWRRSIKIINLGFSHGFLHDGRGRVMFEVDRGAVFSHTQTGDTRFDDLFSVANANDMQNFQFNVSISDPALKALLDPNDPNFKHLVNEPYATVPAVTDAQKRGQNVFNKFCFSCHNTPQVFNNLANVEPTGNGERAVTNPSFAPAVGHLFNIGVSERNKHHLRFTQDLGNGQFQTIVLPMAAEDGALVNVTVNMDIGLAATTGRVEDVGRFKVPQLRQLKLNAPYFHDNSADTLEEVVDYFNSDAYNNSKDGKAFPIHLNAKQRADLLAFLNVL